MLGFLFYMITGSALSIYRLFIADVHPDDPWFKKRESHLKALSSWPIPVQLSVILFMSSVMIPITLADAVTFLISRLQMRRYNTNEVRGDVAKYVQFGILYGEAVSYSAYNRFSSEETEQIEEVFKEAEARIIKHGFIPLTVGNFVEFYQEGKDLPQLRIKGKVYPDKAA